MNLTTEQSQMIQAIETNDKFMFQKLGGCDDFNLNFDITDKGIFPLLLASAKGKNEIVELMMLNKNLDINRTDKFGINAFWIAAFYENVDLIKILLKNGIDMMCKNQNGSNALHISVKQGNRQVIKTLLDFHYPLNYTKNNGVSALGIAAYTGNKEAMEMLINAGADINNQQKGVSPLFLAIKGKKTECIKYLLERKVIVHFNDADLSEFSPLFFSIRESNLEALQLMCDNPYSPVDLDQVKIIEGYNPLTYAVEIEKDEVVEYLMKKVKNINEEDPEGFSSFAKYLLMYNDHEFAYKFLVYGNNAAETINYCNRDGKSVLTLAILQENEDAVRYLISKKADPHIKDVSGKDSCDYALQTPQFKDLPYFNNCDPTLQKTHNEKLSSYNQNEKAKNSSKFDILKGYTYFQEQANLPSSTINEQQVLRGVDQAHTQLIDSNYGPFYYDLDRKMHDYEFEYQQLKDENFSQYQSQVQSPVQKLDQVNLINPNPQRKIRGLKEKIDGIIQINPIKEDPQVQVRKRLSSQDIWMTTDGTQADQQETDYGLTSLIQNQEHKVVQLKNISKISDYFEDEEGRSFNHLNERDQSKQNRRNIVSRVYQQNKQVQQQQFKHPKTLGIRGFNYDQIDERNFDNTKQVHILNQVGEEVLRQQHHYGQDFKNDTKMEEKSSWIEKIGKKAAENLINLRKEIESQLLQQKTQDFINNSIVQPELNQINLTYVLPQIKPTSRNDQIYNNYQSQKLDLLKRNTSLDPLPIKQTQISDLSYQTINPRIEQKSLFAYDTLGTSIANQYFDKDQVQQQKFYDTNKEQSRFFFTNGQQINDVNSLKSRLNQTFDKSQQEEPQSFYRSVIRDPKISQFLSRQSQNRAQTTMIAPFHDQLLLHPKLHQNQADKDQIYNSFKKSKAFPPISTTDSTAHYQQKEFSLLDKELKYKQQYQRKKARGIIITTIIEIIKGTLTRALLLQTMKLTLSGPKWVGTKGKAGLIWVEVIQGQAMDFT